MGELCIQMHLCSFVNGTTRNTRHQISDFQKLARDTVGQYVQPRIRVCASQAMHQLSIYMPKPQLSHTLALIAGKLIVFECVCLAHVLGEEQHCRRLELN